MKNKILWTLSILPMIVTAIAVQFMADKVPVHYGTGNQIDRWGSKYECFLYPAFIVAMAVVWCVLIHYFRKKQLSVSEEKQIAEARQNEKVLYYMAVGVTVLLNVVQYFHLFSVIDEANGQKNVVDCDIQVVAYIVLGFLLILFGNIMPKCKKNSIVGLRTTWSMKNDQNWAKCNRFGGFTMIICGILIIIETAFFSGKTSTSIVVAILILDTIVDIVYSYNVDRKRILNT